MYTIRIESFSTETEKIWFFDGFGTTCCYCLCLNNSVLNCCTRPFSHRHDATQKVTGLLVFMRTTLISIQCTIEDFWIYNFSEKYCQSGFLYSSSPKNLGFQISFLVLCEKLRIYQSNQLHCKGLQGICIGTTVKWLWSSFDYSNPLTQSVKLLVINDILHGTLSLPCSNQSFDYQSLVP